MYVQAHRYHSITWIYFYEAFSTLQWAHLRRHQIIGKNTCTAWVFRPTFGWVDILRGDNIRLDAGY